MALIAVDRGMGAGAPAAGIHRSKLVLAILAAACAVAVVGFAGFGAERLWRLHLANASLRSALETGITLSALVSAVLLYAHFRQTRLLRDLLLLAALTTVALTDFVFNALPAYHYETGIYGAGARMALTLLISGIFVAAAFVPGEQKVAGGRRLVTIAVPAAIYWVALGELVDLVVGPVRSYGPSGDFAPLSIVMAVGAFVLLVISAGGFAWLRERSDAEAGLLATAAVLMAGAQLSKLAVPIRPADWVLPVDVLRIAVYALLLVASLRLYRRSQAQKARDALSAERQRIARDLHDGLAQDLAFIAAHSERLAKDYGDEHPLTIAASRALAASRGKIVDLEASSAPTTEAALREVAAELSARFGVRVTVKVDGPDGVSHCDRSERERRELVRIAREAIANAARHGGATHVTVILGSRDDDLLLRVTDDGCGFGAATSDTAGTGLGMRTMRERAARLGARVRTNHAEHGGAKIDVVAAPGSARSDV
jgi:signal transduction histidine kinase